MRTLITGLPSNDTHLSKIRRLFASTTPLLFKGLFAVAQSAPHPSQPLDGPGSRSYAHASVQFFDNATSADGYWLFLPADPVPASAEVIVFMHGYGAYNPMCYGKWIKHLVGQGNIVIYPRYQKNLIWPRPNSFPANAAKGVRDALKHLEKNGPIRPLTDRMIYIGHSYGGTINAYIGVHFQRLRLPKPAAMLLAQPGTGPFKGAILDSYDGMPADLNLVTIASEHDWVVGDLISRKVFDTAINTPNRRMVTHRSMVEDNRILYATHNDPYCFDLDFDTGVRNYTSLKALRVSRLNTTDFNCFWKIGDALISYTREGKNGSYFLEDTPLSRQMGKWPNGEPIQALRVEKPSE
jgi:acetyl esterase/lipase